ncbi:TIGR04002 family protein [Ruminococcaceae bacterium OttesenSCG-928-I18]|nr:TIGR04002 family protein [Ruminococcaceae bacterium OttesenSCG-928-I18]
MKKEQIKKITYTGLFAALIFLAVYVIRVPIGANGSYIHFGDAIIYLAAVMLPLPYAMVAAAIGAGLSDVLAPGGMVWLPATLIIKPLLCLAFSRNGQGIVSKRNIAALFIGGGITIVGYALAAFFLFGNIASSIAELPISLVQSAGSGLLFIVLGKLLYKVTKGHALVG